MFLLLIISVIALVILIVSVYYRPRLTKKKLDIMCWSTFGLAAIMALISYVIGYNPLFCIPLLLAGVSTTVDLK